jgi:hypothetical protein
VPPVGDLQKKKLKIDRMEKYKFLFKPLFYIASLLFSSWLVLSIEKLHPSDLGRYQHVFEIDTMNISKKTSAKKRTLRKIMNEYKAGLLDTTNLDMELDKVLEYEVK